MNSETSIDKRKFHRIFYNAQAELSNGQTTWKCQIRDLSLKGCLLNFSEAWQGEIDSIYILSFALSNDLSISMSVSVSHVIGDNAGFKCEHIDIESITALRRLVELNLGNSELLERDLASLAECFKPDSE
ncbi:PilZ domain-containing protein [Methylicorpusculum oleiharenae]|uniref:PilZ domain-containing protein n=1 Tax=Methylicorpusculum oleiharenae TaxID=1338687 RepID=UPI001358137F|nr:PilZ domain-containing protein [Methylicorpusculum oleiharenae]MCD2453071.1 PilZ domain-containing protein [Methylicorpusculum oleiharenae]